MIKKIYKQCISKAKAFIAECKLKRSINYRAKIILRKVIPIFITLYKPSIQVQPYLDSKIAIYQQALFRKIVDLLSGIAYNSLSHCSLSAITNARTLLETIISFIAFYHKLELAVQKQDLMQAHEEIRIYLMNSRNEEYSHFHLEIFDSILKEDIQKSAFQDILSKIFKSKDDSKKLEILLDEVYKFFIPNTNIEFVKEYIRKNFARYQTINILSELQYIEKHCPGISKDYDVLSEMCHPNFDGLIGLYAECKEDRVIFLDRAPLQNIEETIRLAAKYGKLLYNYNNKLYNLSKNLDALDNSYSQP